MTGIITLSIELELGWGRHDKNEFAHLSLDRSAENRALNRLLESCDQSGIPVTFDIVGHLLHESCTGSHGNCYPEGWWRNDPGTSVQEDPLFYAPDLVERIENAEVDHEICTHTYSHVLSNASSAEVIENELQTANELHDALEIPTSTSIVMPRHHDIDYSLLADHGFRTIRRPIEGYGVDVSGPRKLWWLLSREHPVCSIKEVDGIIETTCTPHPSLTSTALPYGQRSPPQFYRVVPEKIRKWFHRRYLEGAIRRSIKDDAHMHLWTHLYNLANESQWSLIESALSSLAVARNKGDVEIKPMGELPEVIE